MSDQVANDNDNGSALPKVVGGLGGGALAGGLVYNHLANRKLRDLDNAAIGEGEIGKKFLGATAKEFNALNDAEHVLQTATYAVTDQKAALANAEAAELAAQEAVKNLPVVDANAAADVVAQAEEVATKARAAATAATEAKTAAQTELAALEEKFTAATTSYTQADAAHEAVEKKVLGELGLAKAEERVAKLDDAKVQEHKGKMSATKRVAKNQFGFAALHKGSADNVVFEQVGDKFKAHITLKPEALEGLTKEAIEQLGIAENKMVIEGIPHLPAGVTIDAATKKTSALGQEAIEALKLMPADAKEGTFTWLLQAEQAIESAEKGNLQKETISAMRKVGGFGWSFGNLTTAGKAGVGAAVVAGVAAGAIAANAIFGGKHTSRANDERQNDMPQGFARA